MIRTVIETSLVDWDGKISTVLFFDRCNFKCPFCQNWELILHSEKYPAIPLEEIVKKLKKKRDWIDGVVLSGGEPLVYRKEVIKIAKVMKGMNFGVKLDTHGAFPSRLKELIKENLVDYVAMDIKAPLDDSYYIAAGMKAGKSRSMFLQKIKESINFLMKGFVGYEFRTTCVPGIIDKDTIKKIGEEIKGAKRWVLQVFIADNAYKEEYRHRKFDSLELENFIKIAQRYVPDTQLRGKK